LRDLDIYLKVYNSTGVIQVSFLGVYNSTGGIQISITDEKYGRISRMIRLDIEKKIN